MDPYKVLGVSPNDSDDKIKQAYRELARKYHPDRYANNPLADLAQEKMKEINEAYDAITKERAGGGSQRSSSYGSGSYGSQSSYGGYSGQSYNNASTSQFSEIRMLINMGRLDEAYKTLMGISQRGAEWHYLIGQIYYRRGMYDLARENYSRAYQMEPSNPEYASAMSTMNNAGGMFRTGGVPGGQSCSICDICAGIAIADCLCDCCGGGF